VSRDFDWSVNESFQAALAHTLDQAGNGDCPDTMDTAGFGLRPVSNPLVIAQLHVNLSHQSPDQGALADTTDTAGSVVYSSPGITVQVLHTLHFYRVAQIPVYSNLDGYQLFPRSTATAGLSYAN
jgi:hypothetical protein